VGSQDEYAELCDDVRALCGEFGAILEGRILRSEEEAEGDDDPFAAPGDAVVTFLGKEQAADCIDHLQGRVVQVGCVCCCCCCC
jgi:hypothetical protein